MGGRGNRVSERIFVSEPTPQCSCAEVNRHCLKLRYLWINVSILFRVVERKYYSLSRVQLFVTPMDCSPPGSFVHGILQARILEWVAIPFSRGSSQPKDQTQVSCISGRFFNIWTTREELWKQPTRRTSTITLLNCCFQRKKTENMLEKEWIRVENPCFLL